MHVVIVGGGIAGLTAALALREAEIEATVYDRAEDVTKAQIGAGLGLAQNATRVLRSVGVLDRLLEVAARGEQFEFRRPDGKLLSAWTIPEGELQLGVTRHALHEALVGALPPGTIVCGRECTGFEQDDASVEVMFADGQSVRGDVLVGADGLRSVLRERMLGAEQPRYAGFSVLRCLVPAAGDDPLPRGTFRLFWGRGACIGMYHVAPDLVYTFGWWPGSEGDHVPRGQRKQALLNRFGSWSREAPALIEKMNEDDIHQTDIYDRAPATSWGQGRITLAGDAAHPMTFNMGQGACQGIEDAVVLARALVRAGDVPASLRSYEQERIERTTQFTKMSARVASMSLIEAGPKLKVRDLMLRIVGRNISRGEKMLRIDADIPRAGAAATPSL